jgi:hypothetical protein
MRRRAGIDDVELAEAIRGLRKGDLVRLTLLTGTGSSAGELVSVRIVSIRPAGFEGTLIQRPDSHSLTHLRVGSRVRFTMDHIHSVSKGG